MTATPRMRAFEGVDGGDGNGGDAPLAGQGDHGQDAGGVAQGAIEAQLAQEEVAWGGEGDLFVGSEQGHGHGQVVAGGVISGRTYQIGRRYLLGVAVFIRDSLASMLKSES
jgi:hypothetical protein